MKLEVGKTYRTFNGKKAQVTGIVRGSDWLRFSGFADGGETCWDEFGISHMLTTPDFDIVGEWPNPICSSLEQPSTESTFYLCWNPTGKTEPKLRHVTRDGAEAEARRLVEDLGINEVYVLEAVTHVQRARTIVSSLDKQETSNKSDHRDEQIRDLQAMLKEATDLIEKIGTTEAKRSNVMNEAREWLAKSYPF